MEIQKLHSGFIMPTKGTDKAGAYDVYMPTSGCAVNQQQLFGLGFAAAVPENHVALLLPRSSAGVKQGLELTNTCGVIDSDYRGEWMVALRTKNSEPFAWAAGDRLIQFLIVPVLEVQLREVITLDKTARGEGGFGSSGK